jgi:ABC-2 type transport system permease protein
VPYSDLLISETDYQTYESTVTGIDVEGQITSAIQYVTSDNLPKMYMVEGHGEAELGETITNGISKLNVSTDKLSTLTEKSIPKDCQILLINGPTSDYSKDEVTMIEDYLAAGGKAIIFTTYTTETMTNFKELLTYYGVQLEDGLLVESTGNYVGNYPTYIVPSVKNHDITSSIISNGSVVVMPVAQGITAIDNVRSSLKVEPLLTSSDGSYSKINVDSQTIEKEEGDITGPFNLGVAITEINDEKESKLAIFTSSYLIDEEMVSTGQFANGDLLFNSISWMADMESGLSIPTRSVEQTYLTVSNAQISFWGALLVFILPMMILGSGLFIWLRRRKG